MQLDRNSFFGGDVVLDNVNKASRDEKNILTKQIKGTYTLKWQKL